MVNKKTFYLFCAPPPRRLFGLALLLMVLSLLPSAPLRSQDGKPQKEKKKLVLPSPDSLENAALNTPRPLFWRAVIEDFAFITGSSIRYWINYVDFQEDWKWRLTLSDQFNRIFELNAFRFDSNNFELNWTHVMAGAIYYNFARSNHWSIGNSALLTMATSLFWESITEYREVIAINDNIMTGLGGIVSGEIYFQTAQFLLGQSQWWKRVLSWFFNPIAAGNRMLDHNRSYAYATPSKERFELRIGNSRSYHDPEKPATNYTQFVINLRLSHVPTGLAKAGRKLKITPITYSRFNVQFRFLGSRLEDADITTKTGFASTLWRLGSDLSDQNPRQSYCRLNLTAQYDFHQRRAIAPYDSTHRIYDTEWASNVTLPTAFLDKWAALDLFGPEFYWQKPLSAALLKLDISATPCFALINALALNEYSRQHPIDQAKTTLKEYGYYYGWGASLHATAEIDWHAFSLRQECLYRFLYSIDSLDRFTPIADNFSVRDSFFRYRAELSFRLSGSPLGVSLAFEHLFRAGYIAPITVHHEDDRLACSLVFFL